MLEASRLRIESDLAPGALVLDVGGWAKPLRRADWVIDMFGHETRGLYGYDGPSEDERFSAETWVQRDICAREPWPFEDGRFDFAVCSHTLEDVRDPVWVCQELQRVARAGYVEVPSRAEEQTYGVQGPWVGWGHHHWLVDVHESAIDFVFKHHVLAREDLHLPAGSADALSDQQRVQQLWWQASFEARELVFVDAERLEAHLRAMLPPRPAQRRRGLRRGRGRRT